MKELTGAFLIAKEKGEDLLTTRQSLANAGYPIQDIEDALTESKQILAQRESNQIQADQPIKKKKKWWKILLFAILILVPLGSLIFFFWDNIMGLFGGS
jgi:uncharacterized membrane protein YcjF (UPF0283 family)